MKIGTWNVNGIRARQSQVTEWIERDRPDVVCLQEIKAATAQVPPALCEMAGYWCYWHGERAYSGVGLHVRRDAFSDEPKFGHPAFDHENRIVSAEVGNLVFASIYVPNGGKDFPAKMRFLEEMDRWVAETHASGKSMVLCGDLNVARTDRDVHPKERKPNCIGQLPEERALIEQILVARARGRRPRARPRQRRPLHLVGAVAEHAAAQHRVAARLRAREHAAGGTGRVVRGAGAVRHERSRSRGGDVWGGGSWRFRSQ